MNRLLPIALLSMLAIFSNMSYAAGTVTLTGTCQSGLGKNGNINFSILNSGSDFASSVILQSYTAFSSRKTGTYAAKQIGPGQNIFFNISSGIVNRTGSFAYSFLLTYQQGTQTFTVLFPCVVNSGNVSQSLLRITNLSVTDINSTTGRISGSIYSLSQNSISGNITLMLPPALERNGGAAASFTINPYQYYNFTLYSGLPQQNNSYSGAVALEYSENGITHSSASIITVSPSPISQNRLKGYLVQAGIMFVIAVIVILFIRQRMIRRKKSVHPE